MRNNITRNITLSSNERVVKDFRRLQAVNTFAQIMLTSKRLIIYTKGIANNRGKKVSRKMMNEIELRSIHRFEYYIESKKEPFLLRLLGFIFFVGAAYLVYLYYSQKFAIPAYYYQSMYTDYAIFGLVMLGGLFFMFHASSILYLQVKSGLEEKTTLRLRASKYNEMTLRYLAGKIHIN